MTVIVVPAVPAVAVAGKTAEIVGAGGVAGEIVNAIALESTPEFETWICTEPEEAMSEAGTVAVSCVELTKVFCKVDGRAGGGFTIQLTMEPGTKLVPVTVSTTSEAPHDGVELFEVVDEDKEVIVGPVIVNGIEQFDVQADDPCVSKVTSAVPVVRKSAGGTVAVNCVALLKTVGNEVTTLLGLVHCTTEQGRIPAPVTVKVMAELPAPAVVCDRVLRPGVARGVLEVVSVTAEVGDVPMEFVTVTLAVPGNAAAVAGIAAVT